MPTNKSAGKGPKKAVVEDTYEPEAFVKKFGMPIGEAKTIIKRYGPSRRKIDAHMAARNA